MPGIIVIDASDLVRMGYSIEIASKESKRLIEWRLSMAARERVNALCDEAPSQARSDARHPIKVKDSFSYTRGPGALARTVVTSAPYKVSLLTTGTRPHMIYPRFKEALWWPGLGHPIPWVGPPYTRVHPGTRPNLFVKSALAKYGFGDDRHAQFIADATVIGITTRVYPAMVGDE